VQILQGVLQREMLKALAAAK